LSARCFSSQAAADYSSAAAFAALAHHPLPDIGRQRSAANGHWTLP